ncbi:hypothetical protein FHG87_018251 [Trinorchestia longiramus]|nr:hypothetical protein FHG87_018251 [Trinorchestia longiramus]
MTRLRRPPSSAWLRRGPLIVKVLFIICIIQIVFTVYVAVRVLKSSLEPDGFVFGGLPSALSERQRDLAEVLGSLDRLDFQQPVEFIPDNIENKGKPTMRRFVMRPLSIMDVVRHDQELNQLIVSDNKIKSKAPASNASFTGDSPPKSFSSKFPSLKMYKIRPVDAEDYETFSSKNDVLMKEMARDSPGVVAKSSAKKVDLLNLGSNKHSTKAGEKLFNSSPYNEAIHRIDSKHKLGNFATLNSSRRPNNNIFSGQAFPSKSFNHNQASGAQTTLKTTGSKSDSRSQNIFLKYNHSLQTRAAEKLSMTKHSNTIAYPGRTRIINMPNLVSNQKLNLNAKSLYEDQDHQTHDDGNHTSQVLIYSLARSLGRYLWTHVIGGVLKEDSTVAGALVDNKTVEGITFVYREDTTGRAQLPSMGHHSVVLVASGETEASISVTREWLDHSADSRVATVKLLLVLRGSAVRMETFLFYFVVCFQDDVSSGINRDHFCYLWDYLPDLWDV